MRPKIVLVILIAGLGMLALLGFLHGKMTKQTSQDLPEPPIETGINISNSSKVVWNKPEITMAVNNVIATTTAEDRAAQKEKDLAALNDLLVSTETTNAIMVIVSRLENEDAEVRTAAREVALHLGDTNVIPYLTAALDHINDPREKVAIMDAITYLQLPSDADRRKQDGADTLPVDISEPLGVSKPK